MPKVAKLPAEAASYPVTGTVLLNDVPLAPNLMALLDTTQHVQQRVRAEGDARFVVIGGAQLDGCRFMFRNAFRCRRGRWVGLICDDREDRAGQNS